MSGNAPGTTDADHERLLDENWRLREAAEKARAVEADLRRALAATEAESVGKTRLLATATHEIRTPLAAIIGMADLILSEPLSAAQGTYARAIQSSSRALLSLVDDVLDVARMETGRLELQPRPTEILGLLEDLVELIAPRAQSRGLSLALVLDSPLPQTVEVDAGRLRQILLNLVGNAVKFTEQGGVELRVATLSRVDGMARLAFSVHDTGPGIDPMDQARIFEDFVQIDDNGARQQDGAGLGLSISRTLVAAMGGGIVLARAPGGGSIFSFVLDLAVRGEAMVPEPGLKGVRALILAARPDQGASIATALARLGAEAVCEASPWRTRAALASGSFDILMTDHGPGSDAGLLLDEVGPSRPPAVALVPATERHILPDLQRRGFGGHLVKPVRLASLAKIVSALVHRVAVAEDLSPPMPGPTRSGRPARRVLLAEDDEFSALIGRTLLVRAGADVVVVETGEAAVAAARRERFDLILMDLHMPGMDGIAAISAIRAFADGADRPILALTADPTAATEAALRAAGADGRLVKPLTAEALREVLDRLAPESAAGSGGACH